jgi:hypothetical protein
MDSRIYIIGYVVYMRSPLPLPIEGVLQWQAFRLSLRDGAGQFNGLGRLQAVALVFRELPVVTQVTFGAF